MRKKRKHPLLEKDHFKEPLDFGSFYDASEHHSEGENKDKEDHFEPQNEDSIVDKGDQLSQNQNEGGQNAGTQKAEVQQNKDIHPSEGVEVVESHNPLSYAPAQDDLNVDIIVDVLPKLRTIDSSTEKVGAKEEESSQKAKEVGVVATLAQNAPKTEVGERTLVGSVKHLVFKTKNLGDLFNSPIFYSSVEIACGFGPIHSEPSTFSIPFPSLPTVLVIV